MPDTLTTMIMPVAAVAAANRIAHVLNVDLGGEHTFEVCRVSPNAQEPATHVCSSSHLCEEVIPLLTDSAALYARVVQLAAERERECPTLADCELAVNSVIIVFDLDALTAIQAQGLQVVEVPV